MMQTLQSKTNSALLVMLLVVVGLACFGKLTGDVVDALKWICSTFFAVRGISNFKEAPRA